MKTVPIVVAITMSAVANFGVAEAEADQNAPAAVTSQAAKKAWFAHAIDHILSEPVTPTRRDRLEQGRSAGRPSPR